MARKKKGGGGASNKPVSGQQQAQASTNAATASKSQAAPNQAPRASGNNNRNNSSNKGSNGGATTTTTKDGITVSVYPDVYHSGGKLVGAIDQGTSSTRFLLFNCQGQIVAAAQQEHPQLYPRTGWHEHDPVVLWSNTGQCIGAVGRAVSEQLSLALNSETVAAIGITNQRETVIAWNKVTGEPYYNAIVWDDTRTFEYAEALQEKDAVAVQHLTKTTGLPVSSYFAGTKVQWLLSHVPQLRADVETKPDQVCFGTVDCWLLYQLTGMCPKSDETHRRLKGAAGWKNTGGTFQTDVTNASRWMFMDLKTCAWDATCLQTVLGEDYLPQLQQCLPEIRPSSHVFGHVNRECGVAPAGLLEGVPLAAILGDQQAALFGQTAFNPGQAKNTYGTGLFLMMNTGIVPCTSTHGLLTTVAYQLGGNANGEGEPGKVHYALEGSVSHSGSTVQWLRDQLQIIRSNADSETVAKTVKSSEGLYVVPAFAGLFAPHWRSDARGCIVGLQMSHHRGHVCRAVLEATAYQTKEVFDAMVKDTAGLFDMNDGAGDAASPLSTLSVDGGGTNNKLLMQFQADIIDVPVVKPKVMETTSLGAAFAAGLAVGVWKDLPEIQALWAVAETFQPHMLEDERAERVHGWNKAVSKSMGWVGGSYDQHPEFTPVAQPMSSRSLASLASSSSSGKNGIGISPLTPLKKVVEKADVPAPLVAKVAAPTLAVEEEKKSADQVVDSNAVTSREIPSSNGPAATPNEDGGGGKFSAAALGVTAVAALGAGILLGGARKR